MNYSQRLTSVAIRAFFANVTSDDQALGIYQRLLESSVALEEQPASTLEDTPWAAVEQLTIGELLDVVQDLREDIERLFQDAPPPQAEMAIVVIEVGGGLVHDVAIRGHCTAVVLDYDNGEENDNEPEIPNRCGSRASLCTYSESPDTAEWIGEIQALSDLQGQTFAAALEAVALASGHMSWVCRDNSNNVMQFESTDGKQSASVTLEAGKVIDCVVTSAST